MRKLSVVLIIIGILVASYPLMEQIFTWYWQNKLLSEWEQPVQAEPVEPGFQQLDIIEKLETQETQEPEVDNTIPLTPQGETLGILKIDSIDVKLPIIKGLSETNLKMGIAYLEDTPLLGEKGNTVLAGHRGRSYGRLLNRLNEVKLKDKIVVSTKNGAYTYIVSNIVIVKPEEIEILRSVKDEEMLTIVTCEPVYKPTHRLIVQATREEGRF